MIQITENQGSPKTIQTETQIGSPAKGEFRSRPVVPVSHGEQAMQQQPISKTKVIVSQVLSTLLLVTGVTLWVVGQNQMNPSMLLAGRVLTGLALGPYALAIGCAILCCPCICCFFMNRQQTEETGTQSRQRNYGVFSQPQYRGMHSGYPSTNSFGSNWQSEQ